MSGPPPIPFVVRKMRGNPGRRPLRQAPEPAILPKCPEPPDWLHEYAKAEWWRTAPQLHVLGLLSSVDGACLAAYCHSYAMWREASEELARIDKGLLIKTDGKLYRNPLIKVIRDAAADMVRYAGEFGLTPVARTRLAQGIHQQAPSKFDGLLADAHKGEPVI
jgi:P27 family predicted phage terminase small subunit